jgi:antitoxin PrlF
LTESNTCSTVVLLMQITTVNTKGQVTIPKEIRDELGIKPGDKIVSEKDGDDVRLKVVPDFFSLKGSVKPLSDRPDDMQELIKLETKAAQEYVAQQYTKKEEKIKKQLREDEQNS